MVNLNMHEKELTIESIERMDFVTMAAGLSLILVSVLVATDRFDILRNFVFSGFLGFTFLDTFLEVTGLAHRPNRVKSTPKSCGSKIFISKRFMENL